MRAMLFAAALLAALSIAVLQQIPAAAQSADAERGRLLYENHCTVCHESVVHVRDDRKVDSRAALLGYVARWQDYLGLGWSAEEMNDVRAYLNEQYYGF